MKNEEIWIIDVCLTTVITFVGGETSGLLNGSGSQAKFSTPIALAVDPSGNLFVADRRNCRVRKISPLGKHYFSLLVND
jgi:hypothetical protein